MRLRVCGEWGGGGWKVVVGLIISEPACAYRVCIQKHMYVLYVYVCISM